MKRLVVGILAHVDAGKTTMSESMLYLCGKIRRMGRVDNQDAYLDTFDLEKARGITIYSKQAVMNLGETEITLLDTPGHVDFSAEMERTLQVLDYAILIISGADGVQSHTRTLWDLLRTYEIPTFIFVNKMDQKGAEREGILESLHQHLSDKCIPFDLAENELMESLALCDEGILESYLNRGRIEDVKIRQAISSRKVFPTYFGSALRQMGVEAFLKGFDHFTSIKDYPEGFAAKVFKISRDEQGNRLTHLKITGGTLKVKDTVAIQDREEKINQIRIYSGEKYQTVNELGAGSVGAVTGPVKTRPGDGIGLEEESNPSQLEPVLAYRVVLPEGVDEGQMLPYLREIEEEEPELRIHWNKTLHAISIQVMGAVQLEILQSVIKERFDVNVTFDEGQIVYKETITEKCEGVGHFEPLRHYAEVHLVIEPRERGSGISFESICSEDILNKNWQRLVLTHLKEKEPIGVLTGSALTDVRVALVTGRAHNKHTTGGDFREATYRALRQGLKEAQSILLEPYYRFTLTLPESFIGRAMTDIEKMSGRCSIEQENGQFAVLSGEAPVSTMQNYQKEVMAYTKGEGRLATTVSGYDICHNPDEIIESMGYDSERDVDNPTGSVFCTKGSSFIVPWNEVKKHMHVESFLKMEKDMKRDERSRNRGAYKETSLSLEEIDAIFSKAHYANQGKKSAWKKRRRMKDNDYPPTVIREPSREGKTQEEYLLVDGYNIIFAWPEFEQMIKGSMDGARMKLIDLLSNYQATCRSKIMVVFDAYRVEGGVESVEDYHNIQVVFTREAQTADHFIERFAHTHQNDYRITVATSDGMQQIIVRGAGARLLSAGELRERIIEAEEKIERKILSEKSSRKSKIEDLMDEDTQDQLKKL